MRCVEVRTHFDDAFDGALVVLRLRDVSFKPFDSVSCAWLVGEASRRVLIVLIFVERVGVPHVVLYDESECETMCLSLEVTHHLDVLVEEEVTILGHLQGSQVSGYTRILEK